MYPALIFSGAFGLLVAMLSAMKTVAELFCFGTRHKNAAAHALHHFLRMIFLVFFHARVVRFHFGKVPQSQANHDDDNNDYPKNNFTHA